MLTVSEPCRLCCSCLLVVVDDAQMRGTAVGSSFDTSTPVASRGLEKQTTVALGDASRTAPMPVAQVGLTVLTPEGEYEESRYVST
jgi:hypothetical protein